MGWVGVNSLNEMVHVSIYMCTPKFSGGSNNANFSIPSTTLRYFREKSMEEP